MKFGPAHSTIDTVFDSMAEAMQWIRDPKLRVIADALPDGLVIVDQRGLVGLINSAAEAINQVNRTSQIGQPLSLFTRDSALDSGTLVSAYQERAKVSRVVKAADGREFLLTTRPLRNKEGDVVFYVIVQRNLDSIRRRSESNDDTAEFVGIFDCPQVAGRSAEPVIFDPKTAAIVEHAVRALTLNCRVLLIGESGVGKTEVAKYLCDQVMGPAAPFVHVNCGSIPETLFESEMFGYERGAFTGALQRGKAGLIEAANGGLLFLDEIGEIPLTCQAKLLKFLEDGVLQRVGSTGVRRVRVQVIAATNRNLEEMIAAGRFRRDLFYRLTAVTLRLPPLRERRSAIPALIDLFLERMGRRRGTPIVPSEACLHRLNEYHYPGNIRELQNIVEHLAVVSGVTAEEEHLPPSVRIPSAGRLVPLLEEMPCAVAAAGLEPASRPGESEIAPQLELKEQVRRFETHLIQQAIQRLGSKRKAAAALGVDVATIVRKSKEMQLSS
ncbi:MAG: diguanylate cyclase [Alphaproteobacteria bacterium]|nr:MAG: diguanylate cyclase [Alphaproteobacteria bacterium]